MEINVATLVQELPVLDYAEPIRQYIEGSVEIPFNSPWKNAEKEFAIAILVHLCAKSGDWHAVSAREYGEVLLSMKLYSFTVQDVINALWDLHVSNDVEVICFDSQDYIVPNKTLVTQLTQQGINWATM